jgi:hypothetical protein
MTALTEWVALRENLERWGKEWDAGIVEIRLSDGRLMFLDDAVPDTRGDCPTQKPCPHVRCRHHLWRVDACDRAGRPGLASVPRDEHGHTLRVLGDVGHERAGTTIEARWLESPVPPSCALDEIDGKGRAMTNEECGTSFNRHRTQIARDVEKASERAKQIADSMGMSEADLLKGLRELGAGR